MLLRSELEPIYAHHDHTVFETVSISPGISESIPSHPYPTKIIETSSGDFFLEHFSRFEPGYEGSPNRLIRKNKRDDGSVTEEVLFEFERRNSTRPDYYEYHLITGQDLEGLVLSREIETPRTGLVGRVWAKNDQFIWRYIAGILTNNPRYRVPKGLIDPSVESFLTKQILPEPPADSSSSMDFYIFEAQAA